MHESALAMSASPFPHSDLRERPESVRLDRTSDAPLAIDTSGSHYLQNTGSFRAGGLDAPPIPTGLRSIIPAAWLGMSGYLVAGVLLGIVLIVALSFGRGETTKAAAGTVTDNVVRLQGRDVGEACWRGAKSTQSHVSVAMEIGLDGKVRSAVASAESPAMKSCVEAHVKGWEFLPQAQASTMVLPFEISR